MDVLFTPWYPWLALMLGLLTGSFLNVVIYRLPLMLFRDAISDAERERIPNVNLWWPPSHCPRCQHTVMPWDNIPVVSWLLLRGKCRYCHCAISAIYPLSEALIGVVFWALVFCLYPQYSLVQLTFIALFLCLLYTLALIDITTFCCPTVLCICCYGPGLSPLCVILSRSHREIASWALFLYGVLPG